MKKILTCAIIIGGIIPFIGYSQDTIAISQIPTNLRIAENDAYLTQKMCRDSILSEQFDVAVRGYAAIIEAAQKKRTGTKGVDPDLIAEYAYALALSGAYDGAVVSIDRARSMKAEYADFFTSQIFALMDYPDLAAQFWTENSLLKAPTWLAPRYQTLTEKYKRQPAINTDEPNIAFKRANTLAANKQYIQSILLFQEITDNYPDVYLPYIGYSTVWEKLERHEMAATQLQAGIERMDSLSANDKSVYEHHLRGLHEEIVHANSRSTFDRLLDRYEPSFMLYAGGSIGKQSFALNGRLGFYTNNKISATINLGFSRLAGTNACNIGVSAYKTIDILIFGLGINEQISSHSIFSIAPAMGFSFLNRKGNASYDILFNLFIPVKKDNPLNYSLSFGRTFYFNYNGKKK